MSFPSVWLAVEIRVDEDAPGSGVRLRLDTGRLAALLPILRGIADGSGQLVTRLEELANHARWGGDSKTAGELEQASRDLDRAQEAAPYWSFEGRRLRDGYGVLVYKVTPVSRRPRSRAYYRIVGPQRDVTQLADKLCWLLNLVGFDAVERRFTALRGKGARTFGVNGPTADAIRATAWSEKAERGLVQRPL